MSVFVDTSALYAFLDGDEANNAGAVATLRELVRSDRLVTHNYVVVETTALVHRRLGQAASRGLLEDLLPLVHVSWIDGDVHDAAMSAFLGNLARRVSLVDWVSFEVMRRLGIRTAFCFDGDFARQGFDSVP